MTVEVVSGDLLESDAQMIGHQVNNKGVMGSGVAKQIKAKYPEAYVQYRRFFGIGAMGNCQFVFVDEGKIVCNLFGQSAYGRDEDSIYTDYVALNRAMVRMATYARDNNLTVALPYGIGAGYGNGDWTIIYRMIESAFKDHHVVLYKLND